MPATANPQLQEKSKIKKNLITYGVLLALLVLSAVALVSLNNLAQSSAVAFQQETAQLVGKNYGVEVVSSDIQGMGTFTDPSTITIRKDGKTLTCLLPDRPQAERAAALRGCEPTVK